MDLFRSLLIIRNGCHGIGGGKMERKKSKRKKLQKAREVVIVLVFCMCVCLFCLCEYTNFWFGPPRGPYHHPAVVASPVKTVRVKDTVYGIIPSSSFFYELCILDNGQFKEVETDYFINPTDMQTDGKNLYVSNYRAGIYLFDATGNLIDHIMEKTHVVSFLLDEAEIFYTNKPYIEGTQNETFYLYSYDRESKENRELDIAPIHSITELNNRKVFIDSTNRLHWLDEIGAENQMLPFDYSYYLREISFADGNQVGILSLQNEKIVLKEQEEYVYPLDSENYRFYPCIKEINGIVYFAVNEFSQKEDCEYENCICGFQKSKLLSFDLKTKRFLIHSEIGQQEEYISFGDTFFSYYSNGKVYRNGVEILKIDRIEPFGEYTTHTPFQSWCIGAVAQIYDDGEELFYRYIDCSAWLKDEY